VGVGDDVHELRSGERASFTLSDLTDVRAVYHAP
jgi:hypothetical protein